jgi:hypothetical protein
VTVALRRLALLALSTALVLAATGPASAHKFYASLAQVERTPDGRLEVALRFFPDDLEAALRKATGRRVVVENTRVFGDAFTAWIDTVFSLEAGDRRTAFTYVGAEVSVKTVWVYVECAWPHPLDVSTMTNALLVDLFPEQVNTVNFVEGGRRASKVFDATTRRAGGLMNHVGSGAR